jgi:hypothetical protein
MENPGAQPGLQANDVSHVLIVRPARRKRWWLLPPLVAILLAAALLAVRINTPDWHWSSTRLRSPEPRQAAADPTPKMADVVDRSVDGAVESALGQTRGHDPERAQVASKAQDDIEREAERLRAEREELERIKEQEGERIAAQPPARPRWEARRLAPAEIARLQREQMRRHEEIFRRQLAEMRRFEEQMLRQGGMMPGWAESNFARQRERMDRMMREGLGRMGPGFGADPFGDDLAQAAPGAGGPAPAPPDGFGGMPDLPFDLPRGLPPEVLREMEEAMKGPWGPFDGGADGVREAVPGVGGNRNAPPQPRVRSFNFVTPDGRRISGVQMRWESGAPRFQ